MTSEMRITPTDRLYMASEVLVGGMTVLVNSLVLHAVYRYPRFQAAVCCLFFSLSLADLLNGLVVPALHIIKYLRYPSNFYGCLAVHSVIIIFTSIPILTMVDFMLDRYMCVCHPVKYKSNFTTEWCLCLVVTWMFCLMLGVVSLFVWDISEENFKGDCNLTNAFNDSHVVYLFFFCVYLAPLTIMLVMFLRTFRVIGRRYGLVEDKVDENHSSSRSLKRQLKKDRLVAKEIAYIFLLFAACWTPLQVIRIMAITVPEHSAPQQVLLSAIILSHSHSFLKPFVVVACDPQIYNAVCYGMSLQTKRRSEVSLSLNFRMSAQSEHLSRQHGISFVQGSGLRSSLLPAKPSSRRQPSTKTRRSVMWSSQIPSQEPRGPNTRMSSRHSRSRVQHLGKQAHSSGTPNVEV